MYSWIAESYGGDGGSLVNESFDERMSDVVADTVGGRSRHERENNSILRSSSNTNTSHEKLQQNKYASTVLQEIQPQSHIDDQEEQQQSAAAGGAQFFPRRPFPPMQMDPTVLGNQPQQGTSIALSIPSSIQSEDDFDSQFRKKIQSHPQPGISAARKLNQLVNLPFHARFGSESRVQSSREIEQHRAGSSQNPPLTPLIKDSEPDIAILRDSPRDNQTQIPPAQIQQNHHEPAFKRHHFQQPEWIVPPPTHHESQQQSSNRNISTQTTEHQPSPPEDHSLSPPSFQLHTTPLNFDYHQSRLDKQSQLPRYQGRPRSYSVNDFAPLYDFNRRPWLPPPINVDSWALGPGHHRRLYLDTLVKRVKESGLRNAKLRAQLSHFDKQSRQEIDELELLQREQELEIRRRLHEEQIREQEEIERRNDTRIGRPLTFPPTTRDDHATRNTAPLTSILKKQTTTTQQPPQSSASATRVAFRSPIRSVNRYSPNQSGINSSIPLTSTPFEGRENCPRRNVEIGNSSNSNLPKHTTRSQQQPARLVLSNRTNPISNRQRPIIYPPVDVQTERDREGKRMDYMLKWQQNREQLKQAKRWNPRINLNSNPTSLFQRIPPSQPSQS